MQTAANFARLNADQLRGIVRSQLVLIEDKDRELLWRQTKIDKLTFELAQLKRAPFGHRSEQLPGEQAKLFGETIAADLAAVELEVKAEAEHLAAQGPESATQATPKASPKRAPLPAHVIDKGIPTAQLLAHVLVAKFHDHLPLYRQEAIFARAGVAIARSTLAQ
jgi:hypothetical protein